MPVKSTTNHSLAPPAACGNCRAEERFLLHDVHHRGTFQRLCTSCVLRLHPRSFCPSCFQIYPPPPSKDAVATCFKCYSSSHSRCVASSPPNPYICPLCTHPNSPIFSPREGNLNMRVLDLDAAKKLLAAAEIASASMKEAAAAARTEAERQAKEAACMKKRAKEALEYVAHLEMKEKLKNSESAAAGKVNISNVSASNQAMVALNAVGSKENGKLSNGRNVDDEVISDEDADLVRALEEEMQRDDEGDSDGGEELTNKVNL